MIVKVEITTETGNNKVIMVEYYDDYGDFDQVAEDIRETLSTYSDAEEVTEPMATKDIVGE